MGSSPGPSLSAFPKKTTSGDSGQDHPPLSESLEDVSVSDADSPGIELSRLSTLGSGELDSRPASLERWEQNGEQLGEYVGLCGEKFGPGRSSPVPLTVTNLVETVSVVVT